MNDKVKALLWIVAGVLCLFYLFDDCSCGCGCGCGGLSTGTYEYTDAVNHDYTLELDGDGSAFLKMTSAPKSDIDEIAYRGQRKGVKGTWTKSKFLRGEGTMEYIDVDLPAGSLYICEDGYIYNSYTDMTGGRTSAANKWHR